MCVAKLWMLSLGFAGFLGRCLGLATALDFQQQSLVVLFRDVITRRTLAHVDISSKAAVGLIQR